LPVPVTGGVIWVYGTGDNSFFAASGSGTYTSPQGHFGTLTGTISTNYTYTANECPPGEERGSADGHACIVLRQPLSRFLTCSCNESSQHAWAGVARALPCRPLADVAPGPAICAGKQLR
jgi:hypothetical protein